MVSPMINIMTADTATITADSDAFSAADKGAQYNITVFRRRLNNYLFLHSNARAFNNIISFYIGAWKLLYCTWSY